MTETQLAALLCAFLGGAETETRHYFDAYDQKRYVRTDCETATHVIEIGLDQTSRARDSVQQALFHAELSGKVPAVILIDRDGFEGRFEYEIRRVSKRIGLRFERCSEDLLVRWAATSAFRIAGLDKDLDDVPKTVSAQATCDLTGMNGP